MKVLIATGSFKDVYTPMEACAVIRQALEELPDSLGVRVVDAIPLGDGGEASSDVLLTRKEFERIDVPNVLDPRGEPFDAFYVKLDESSAFIASSTVLHLPPELERFKNPLKLTSYGLGQLIDHALSRGFTRLYVGLGGTSTVDGGLGMAQALGSRFIGQSGQGLGEADGVCLMGKDMISVCDMDCSTIRARAKGVKVFALGDADVHMGQMDLPTNQKIGVPFNEQRDAIRVQLNEGLANYAKVIEANLQRPPSEMVRGIDKVERLPYSGAAGSIVLSLHALFDTKASSGIEFFLDILDVRSRLASCDLVITGEGKIDNSLYGKTPVGLSRLAKECDVPVVYLCGAVADELRPRLSDVVCNDPPESFRDNGVTTILNCESYYAELNLPSTYKEKLDVYKRNSPSYFAKALAEYFENPIRLK